MIKSLEKKLQAEFDPFKLEIVNESHLHAGHQPGFDGTGESHIRIKLISDKFEGVSRVERHRQINAMLGEEIERGLHAIAIEAHTCAEKS